ncbi:MAG: hypothetical protein ACO1NZ_06475, partial [Adhaeribacter sp.]
MKKFLTQGKQISGVSFCNIIKQLKMEITRVGSQPSIKGPEDWFTGAVRIDPLFGANDARRGAA